jgi:hypothetical protein
MLFGKNILFQFFVVEVSSEVLFSVLFAGFLCRDDGEDGLRFFHNFFMDISVATACEEI